jgi:hypothetical protein
VKIERAFEKDGKTWKIVLASDRTYVRITAFSSEKPFVENLLTRGFDSQRQIREEIRPKYEALIAAKVKAGYLLVSERATGMRAAPRVGLHNRKLVRGLPHDGDDVVMKFGAFSRTPSVHRAGLPAQDVFVGDLRSMREMFTPLLAVSLAALDRRLRGHVHFVDHNPNAETPLAFSLRTRDGRTRLAFDDLIEVIGEPTAPRRDFVHFFDVTLPPIPRRVLTGKTSWLELDDDWIDALQTRMAAVRHSLMMTCALGGFPRWIQADATPRCCASLVYIGQLGASAFGGYDQHLYLFHCPKHRIQIQVAQST